ncbi:transglutaminase family protein [Frankia sp. AgB32]|uniref:transglutaminase-like domain-containing protein n=1 Tax=Frankia sp. AgB32 TaxID=631119 RepID=UPI00200FD954|nr:transglutaminase-like domain-containing protein [Frankia sp. AgB32]MCK9894157.1 transglutaminase-like domain-containing protein [Frankia sp. AgB32]
MTAEDQSTRVRAVPAIGVAAGDGRAAGGAAAAVAGRRLATIARLDWALVVEWGLLLLAALAAAGEFRALYAGHGAWAALTGAVLASAAVTAAARRLTGRLDALAVLGLAGAAAYLFVVVFGWVDGRAIGGGHGFAAGLRGGWSNLLAAGLPADPDPALLVVPVLVLWLATALAVALAARPGTVFAPLVPLGLAFATAVALLADDRRPPLAAGMALATAGLGFGLVRAARGAPGGQGPGAGSMLLGVPVVAIAVVAGTVLGAGAPGGDRFDPRTVRPRPVRAVSELDPLAQVRAQLTAAPPRRLGTVRLESSSGRLPVDRMTVAVLGEFDGASWRNPDPYLPVGATLPGEPGENSTGAGEVVTVHADVALDRQDTPMLPILGQPTRLTGVQAAFDPHTGTLVSTAAAAGAGPHYHLTAAVANPSSARLAAAVPGSGTRLAQYLTVPPGLPPVLVATAIRATGGARTAYAQLIALQRYLRDPARFPYDLAGRPGHSYGALTRLLTSADPREQHSYAEQHAAAFALLARLRGFPTRIAVGYLLGPDTASGRGVFTISQARAHAWPEVYLAGLGWIPFEPTDTSHLAHEEPPDTTGGAAGGGSGASAEAAPAPPAPPKLSAIPRFDEHSPAAGGRWHRIALVPIVSLLALLVLFPLAVVAEKARRRRARRRAVPPGRRVAGAWREVRDRLAEWGVSATPTRSAGEVVGDAAGLGAAVAEPIGLLEPLVSRALYDRAASTEADATRAWELVDALRRQLAARASRPRRLAAALDPRPLLPPRGAAARRLGDGRRRTPRPARTRVTTMVGSPDG